MVVFEGAHDHISGLRQAQVRERPSREGTMPSGKENVQGTFHSALPIIVPLSGGMTRVPSIMGFGGGAGCIVGVLDLGGM